MDESANISGYTWSDTGATCAHEYTIPSVLKIIRMEGFDDNKKLRVFDLECGNGTAMAVLANQGYDVVGVDPSIEGIHQARLAHMTLRFEIGSAYDDLAIKYGKFYVVISLDVVEHCFYPRKYARTIFSLVKDGGIAVISTPYHGYWKNLAMAITGKMDSHFTALCDYGHIKFWSLKTLRSLLLEVGFKSVEFKRVGRIPCLAKSMIAIARK